MARTPYGPQSGSNGSPADPPQPWQPPGQAAPLRRDMVTHTYRSARAFNQHAVQMRHAGWQIGPHTTHGNRATVTWFRDVPAHVPPGAFLPAARDGLPPLAIVGIVVGAFVLFGLVAAIGSSSAAKATATPARQAAIPTAANGPTATNAPSSGAAPVAAASSATPVPTAVPTATPVPAPTRVPMVVTVKDNPVPVRQTADQEGAVLSTVPVGADLFVLGDDTTGADGSTRWVPVQADGKNGFVRSDLVTAPHVVTPTPIPPTATRVPPTPTLTAAQQAAQFNQDYPLIDIRELEKNPDAFKGVKFRFVGEIFNIEESKGQTVVQIWVQRPGGSSFDRAAVAGVFQGSTSWLKGQTGTFYVVGAGSFSGTNAFGAKITQPLVQIVRGAP